MVYIVGDNNLDPWVLPDIETELAPAGSNADVQVVALADRAATAEWSQTLLFYVTQACWPRRERYRRLGRGQHGDPQTLIQFIQWTKAHYPADHYALSLWNHGWSWRPYQSMFDETNDDTMDQHELQAVLELAGPIDVLMYDACQMASIENEATVRAYSQAIVHSQEFVNWDGIEYELVLPALQANPGMTAEQLAMTINQSASTNNERTGSAVALNADWDALIVAVDAWAVALHNGLRPTAPTMSRRSALLNISGEIALPGTSTTRPTRSVSRSQTRTSRPKAGGHERGGCGGTRRVAPDFVPWGTRHQHLPAAARGGSG